MTRRVSSSSHPTGLALGVQWLMLIVVMCGMLISTMGDTSSHGLAAISAHAMPTAEVLHHPDNSHHPVHEDQGGTLALVDNSSVADHPHHETDHSHDKAHALSGAWNSAAPQPSSWTAPLRPWIEMVQASRLERPPKG